MYSIPRWQSAVCATSDSIHRIRRGGLGIPSAPDYPQNDANAPTCVVTEIPNTSDYPQTDTNTPVHVGTEIPNTSDYPQNNANTPTCVVTEIPSAPDYPQNDTNAGGSQTYGGKAHHTQTPASAIGKCGGLAKCTVQTIASDNHPRRLTQATIIGSTGTPGFIVEVMVALVT